MTTSIEEKTITTIFHAAKESSEWPSGFAVSSSSAWCPFGVVRSMFVVLEYAVTVVANVIGKNIAEN